MEFPEYPYPQQEGAATNFMTKVYAWMSVGLLVTAGVAYYISQNPALYTPILKSAWGLIGIIVVQFILVIMLSAFIMRMNFFVAFLMFLTYAASVGLTTSMIFLVYTASSIYATFLVAAGMFALTAMYGYFTKTDLSKMGSYLFMFLIGLILTGFVNMFLRSPMVNFVYSIVGVIVFVLFTAYDTQQIKMIARRVMGTEAKKKVALIGALTLYLDFLNLFLFLLNFMGSGKKE